MKKHACPQCGTNTEAEGYVAREGGDRDVLYRCGKSYCRHLFSTPETTAANGGTQRFGSGRQHSGTIVTDC